MKEVSKNMGSKRTERSKRYQEKVGYISKSFKMHKDLADQFKVVCDEQGESMASVIQRSMIDYIEAHGHTYVPSFVRDEEK